MKVELMMKENDIKMMLVSKATIANAEKDGWISLGEMEAREFDKVVDYEVK